MSYRGRKERKNNQSKNKLKCRKEKTSEIKKGERHDKDDEDYSGRTKYSVRTKYGAQPYRRQYL
jgi:hypothetical protein